ncbi:ComEC/Rec2 family competence protein [Microbacterium sp. RU33B]|uniref:ComEC/Rec2 family competence protein n=1 Tax=Microbacterium sp. RU33B TaxID=1907390 RepID=UPI00096330D2|nr:ComEC/Rec2 family competence protein [Microbacterium sp. RU33B]SIT74034.1 competence protein ComEC [Microbacterium sp. RU33B]
MTARAYRLLPVAAATWVAAAVCTLVPGVARSAALAAWVCAVAALCLAAALRARPGAVARTIVVLALACAAAAASSVAFAQPTRSAAAELGVGGGRAIEVAAVVTGKAEEWSTGIVAFDAVASTITVGDDIHSVIAEVQVRAQPGSARPPIGAEVVVHGTARAADAGERAVLVVSARRLEVIRGPDGILAGAAALRDGLVAATSGLPEPGAGLIPGLAVGDTSAVGDELDAAMTQASLSHLTAVSGANCAIVVGLAFAAAAGLGARRSVRVAASVIALAGFVLLVTPEPSVVRAAAMAGAAMLGVLLGRAAAGTSVLALAVSLLLVADPWLSTSLGFALSVAATGALLVWARPLAAGMARWMPRALALALSVPLAAQLACGPPLVLIAPTVPVYGVVANLLAGPAAPAGTIIGLTACLAAPLPWLRSGLTAIAWLPSSWIAGTATTFAALPGAQLPWREGAAGMILLAAVGAAAGLLIAGRGRKGLRIASGGVLALVVGVVTGTAALSGVAGRLTLPGEWAILACDVGQGDAVLVRSAGRVALIDTGPDPRALDACLERVGIERIDLLVLTHFDLDHVGGVSAVTGRVGTVLHGPPASAVDGSVIASLQEEGAEISAATAGMQGDLGDAAWRIVWPVRESRAFPSGNEASVVMEVEGGGVPSALFLGDLDASAQRALAASGALRPPYAVVKVAHHGSADQDASLYALLAPSVALIPVGADNDYGHPREETLALLTASPVGRTDTDGVVAVWETTGGVALWRERDVGTDR